MKKNLPKNWVKIELDSLFSLAYGKGLSVKELLPDGEYNVYGANSIIGKYNAFNQEKSKVIISCRGAASGAIHKTIPKSFVTSNSIVLDAYSDELLLPDYVKYFMTSVDKSEIITGTAQPQITIQLLKNLNFCFPPLAEQQRIVTKLDELFGHLGSLKTRLNHIPQILKSFRQAVLTQAVTGKLTEIWRIGKALEDASFDVPLGNYLTEIKYGTSKKSDYDVDGMPILRIPNIKFGEIDTSDLKFSILDEKEYQKVLLKKGDVLIIRSNGSISIVGKTAIVRDQKEMGYAGYLVRLRSGEKLNSEYLNYMLSSPNLRRQIEEKARSTSGVNNINTTEIKELKINVFDIKEQTEIVKRVEHLFAKADDIEAQYQSLKTKINSLPQAILAKAFKGELVEQLESDGSAEVLLEEIQKLKALSGSAKKSQRIKKK